MPDTVPRTRKAGPYTSAKFAGKLIPCVKFNCRTLRLLGGSRIVGDVGNRLFVAHLAPLERLPFGAGRDQVPAGIKVADSIFAQIIRVCRKAKVAVAGTGVTVGHNGDVRTGSPSLSRILPAMTAAGCSAENEILQLLAGIEREQSLPAVFGRAGKPAMVHPQQVLARFDVVDLEATFRIGIGGVGCSVFLIGWSQLDSRFADGPIRRAPEPPGPRPCIWRVLFLSCH